MQKSKIEWTDYTVNPVRGLCPMDCKDNQGKPYCYARKMYQRFGWNPEIRYEPKEMLDCATIRGEGKRIFVGSTMELFGPWVKDEWLAEIFTMVRSLPQHTFIFLTKQPQNLAKWSPFPENSWVGVSVTSAKDTIIRVPKLNYITAPIKFISFEPLLKPIAPPNPLYVMLKLSGINWCIIGQCTPAKPSTSPSISWIKEIVRAADNAGVKVFLKNNLKSLLAHCNDPWAYNKGLFRQEIPG